MDLSIALDFVSSDQVLCATSCSDKIQQNSEIKLTRKLRAVSNTIYVGAE